MAKNIAKQAAEATGGHELPIERIRNATEEGNDYGESRALAEVLE